ncbi:MAG: T9SS C-terminal target domain-containing protein [Sphingobacteriales bacterium]|nr:MAG: T9SS C-terminal target domain-containing protein [Sphingobacteriales bacterium]
MRIVYTKKIFAFIACWIVSIVLSTAQTISPIVKANLPSVVDESSGLEIINRNNIWSHNDSGNSPKLYNFDSTGALIRILTISNASNVDWEDLAQDSVGNFYIGDFGNNNNDRNDQVIYKIQNPTLIAGNSVTAQTISFSFPDQNAFPPADANLNFDMEAFFWFHHSLYLFSKNRTVPYNGYTKLYRLPETPGSHTAVLVDSLYLGSGPEYITSATGADISPDEKSVALLSGQHIYLFTQFSNDDFFGGTIHQLNFSTLTQKEGIVFISNDEVYLSDELNSGIGQKLYYQNLDQWIDTTTVINNLVEVNPEQSDWSIFPNPVLNELTVQRKLAVGNLKLAVISIHDIYGKEIFHSMNILQSEIINLHSISSGIYFIELNDGSEKFVKKIIKQ